MSNAPPCGRLAPRPQPRRVEPMKPAISPTILAALDEMKRLLREAFGDRLLELRLFGSVARGEAREDSDVDVLVVLDEIRSHSERSRAIDTAYDAGASHLLVLSPLVLGANELRDLRRWETGIAQSLDRDGIPL